MQLRFIRQGSKGDSVLEWEEFLRGRQYYLLEVDGIFDAATCKATKDFQRTHALTIDGKVGNQTWGKALELGFHAVVGDESDWPSKPAFAPMTYHTRERYLGHIAYQRMPTANNPEAITITNKFREYLTTVDVPQLSTIPGMVYKDKRHGRGPRKGKVVVHELAAQSLIDLWQRWDEEGHLRHVLTWAGLWVARFIRGSRTTLSNHSYGTAFDINAPWNGLRRLPALEGKKGSVRKLVKTANELGWYWGGHFTRKDGMHFEWVHPSETKENS